MQHSLMRLPNEDIKIFSYKKFGVTNNLKMYEFTPERGLVDVTPDYNIINLNNGYFSAEITTPNKNCYLLILFNYNPIVLRVGTPPLQFFYWSKRDKLYPYIHYNENGVIVSEGILHKLLHGFNYYTPIEKSLGYVEVNEHPFIINTPYKMSIAGVGINVDWTKIIIRQQFGVLTNNLRFELNKVIKKEFTVNTIKNEFNLISKQNTFNRKIIRQEFNISCK